MTDTVGEAHVDEKAERLLPNAETQQAIEAARQGELSSFSSIDQLFVDLNAGD